MANASLKSVQVDALKIKMIERALTVDSLAAALGVVSITLSNQIAKNFPSARLRLIVENVLGLPLWSSQAQFDSRQQLARQCGFDPFVIHETKLRRHVAALKLRGRSRARRKTALIALLQNHFTKHENTNNLNPPK
jgi:hypothetical protein